MKRIGWVIVAVGVVIALLLVVRIAAPLGPVQPVAFSHAAHVGKRQIACTYCHSYVARTPHATLPDTATCMDCHRVVMTDNPEVRKVLAAFQQGTPLRWVRVTNLPDFVRFTHRRHIQAGVACASCHGDLSQMPIVRKAHSLTMGQCLACHNQRHAPTDCYTCHY